MNKEEIQHKLAQARKDNDLAYAKYVEANNEVNRVVKQLAEPEKPELRHGDYGYTDSGNADGYARIVIKHGNDLMQVGKSNMPIGGCKNQMSNTVLGNIFTDLAEIKPIDGFGKGNQRVLIDDGALIIHPYRVKESDIHAFILKLRGMELKMQQDK